MKLEISQQIFEKYSDIKLHEIRPVGAELFHADIRTVSQPANQTDKQTEKQRDKTKLK
jgi:hypothetical protein